MKAHIKYIDANGTTCDESVLIKDIGSLDSIARAAKELGFSSVEIRVVLDC